MTQQVQPQFTFEGNHLVMYHQEATDLPQVKDANVNDRDRMQDLLSQEKHLTDTYNTAILEASHDSLFQMWKQNQDDCYQLEREIFDAMFKKGWYKLPLADAQSVMHTYGQFEQYKVQLPFPSKIQPMDASVTAGTYQTGAQQGANVQRSAVQHTH